MNLLQQLNKIKCSHFAICRNDCVFIIMIQRFYLFLIVLSVNAVTVWADDSIVSRKSIFVIPHASYQQETNWAAGLVAACYFKSSDLSQISSISSSVTYTLNKQFIVNISPKIYTDNKKWLLSGNLNFQNYPDFFYGIGGNATNLKVGYVSRNFNLTLQPQFILNKRFHIGPLVAFKFAELSTDSSAIFLGQNIYSAFGNAGWSKYDQFTLGVVAAYDSRDNQYYPERGVFLKTIAGLSPKWLGSSFQIADFQLDARYFKSLRAGHVLAIQSLFVGTYGDSLVPFQLLPTIGGADVFRGFRRGMYRDNYLTSIQSEYRFAFYKRLKAVVFLSAGNVFDSHFKGNSDLKIAYGTGLRYRLNDARVHLRFDIAKNNYDPKWQFYITATEAF